jgi:hypothetical protein
MLGLGTRRPGVRALMVGALAACGMVGAVFAFVSSAGASSSSAPGSVVPAKDPFYAAPANIASYSPGQVVASRPVTLSLGVSENAWQISYRSEDSLGNPEMAVTTLVVPTAAWTGKGSRPAVSVEQPEDSTGSQCAPSYVMAGTKGGGEDTDLATMLKDGYAVQDPDYEGPNSAWLAGPQAGHAVLDAIRAADQFAAGGLSGSTPWALDGYSGGANGTGWAAQLQPTYAPDVHLVAVAMGGTPADPKAVGKYIDGTVFAGFEAAAVWGISEDYPGLAAVVKSIENAKGAKALAEVGGECLPTILAQFLGAKLSSFSTVADPIDLPAVQPYLLANTIGQAPPTTAPIYDYHAIGDEIVPVGQDDTLVSNWCADGATVDEVRDKGGEHVIEWTSRMSSVETFIADAFAGDKPTNTCS